MITFEEINSLYVWLDSMFDVSFMLYNKSGHFSFCAKNVSREFWKKTVEPRLPVWVREHHNAPKGGDVTLYLPGIARKEVAKFVAVHGTEVAGWRSEIGNDFTDSWQVSKGKYKNRRKRGVARKRRR